MRVLIIKLTSMGDLMHALPALTDAVREFPGIIFDWVVDEAFAEVPQWHPAIRNIITTSHRRWKKSLWKTLRDGELRHFYRQLNTSDYDVIVDMQNNLKSALVSLLRRGPVAGLDKASCRERPAHLAYKVPIHVNPQQHAVERMRQIMAQALNYPSPTTPADYAADFTSYALPTLDFRLADNYLLFVHNASWLSKMWPVKHWQRLVLLAVEAGYQVLIPSGNQAEYLRAEQIAMVSGHAYALPRLSLNHMAALLQNATAAICSDTGLAHLAAVASTPALTLYGSTDPNLIGTFGQHQSHLVSDKACVPCYKRGCPRPEAEAGLPVCMQEMAPESVWHGLQSLLPAK
ncbi:Lipopolysaccharide heptosyltransferase I [Methylophaga frappieri]|uniref:Lipopolysaccharide heptosyltransferase 1 n=1 Tax=Methylophaga frappieri (strain ATCC BAA-2434 / DSM 25690 / JAM7) TaxID=754477 RepID=I1YKD0_METFJ|nr:lipopolysaccharide heptosyltransferase I [Methylophaga frappieri]AFJ03373.1 Lipopolysaccharide heptosyltransferase I [Methylophaga frappieri]